MRFCDGCWDDSRHAGASDCEEIPLNTELTCENPLLPNPIPSASSSSSYYRGFPPVAFVHGALVLPVHEALPSHVQSVLVSLSSSASTQLLKYWLVVDCALLLLPAPIPVPWLIPPILDLHNSKAMDVEADAAAQETMTMMMELLL